MKLIMLLLVAVSAMAQSETEIVYWSAGSLQGYSSSLKALETERKSTSASQYLANLGNYKFEILRRDASGAGELHHNWTDVFVVQEGEATILYGGEIEDAKETAAGEIRGPRMLAGKSQKVSAGDVIVVPPGVAHQTIVEPGKSFLTLIVKIEKH